MQEPRFLALFGISMKGVPDADAAGGSDPYVRFLLHDHPGKSKETAYTSFKHWAGPNTSPIGASPRRLVFAPRVSGQARKEPTFRPQAQVR